MPHIATWWCGQKSARDEVLSRLDEVAIEGAYSQGVSGFSGRRPVLGSELSASERERLRTAINDRGIDYVGQELVRLSTTPVWDRGASRRARSCCGFSPPQLPVDGPSCPAGFAGSPISSMPEPCRWAMVGGRTIRWSPTRRSRLRPCCRRSIPCGSGASPAGCRAGPPIICSGSAAIWSAPRRRCG